MVKHEESNEVLSVPAQRPLKTGTMNRLLRDVAELTGLTRAEVIERLKEIGTSDVVAGRQ